ncbi:ATP/GTP-binding protein [Streptomyces sp. NPDC051907]|uniref:ATP/GTP-binding protein n=1 Tax=Streptomyces sp. NPDC051907 TaxID=3155284 RepID=UPI00341EEAB3
MLRLGLAAATAALAVVGVGTGAARADEGPGRPGADAGGCEFESFCVGAQAPNRPGASGRKPAGGTASSDSRRPEACTMKKMEPQPPAGSQYWRGRDPQKSTVYVRSCRHFTDTGASALFDEPVWAPNAAPAAAAVDPAVLAQRAVDKMLLAGPKIGIAPGPGQTGLVGMPVWLWTEVGPTTYGPNSASATAGGVSVTATARVSKVVWAMGDGTSVTCTGPGTVYRPAFGRQQSPTCGHVYARTSGSEHGRRYTVTATSTWVVDWTVAGAAGGGQLIETRTAQTQVAIGELQAVGR